MSEIEIWKGLEREVRAERSRVAFERARERREALRPYPDLPAAVAAAARCRCEQRDAIVAALLAEHRATGASVWSAAAILAMAPVLVFLVRLLKGAPGVRNDEKSIVLAAFLEAVSQIGTPDRISLRLYSETRRRALRHRRASLDEVGRRSPRDVDALERADDVSVEALLDRARFVLRARAVEPEVGERPAAYVERLVPSRSRRQRRHRQELLSNQRIASLADLREALRCITETQHDGETR
jgi:hypothetical protein